MPGKVEVTIAGETWELKPLTGLKSFKMLPQIVSIATELIWAIEKSGFPLGEVFSEPDSWDAITVPQILKALKFVSDTLGSRFDELRLNVVPFLLQKDQKWLDESGTLPELAKAIWQAVQFHIGTSFGEETLEALKKSLAAEEAAAGDQTPST